MVISGATCLGPYEVAAQIGVGGMGEVYRATDTNVKRQVAIKVLPASVAGDAERLARFQREAEVLAALNHPNIAGALTARNCSTSLATAGSWPCRFDWVQTVRWRKSALGFLCSRIRVRGMPTGQTQFAVSSDGQRFLMNTLIEDIVTSPITMILNWKPGGLTLPGALIWRSSDGAVNSFFQRRSPVLDDGNGRGPLGRGRHIQKETALPESDETSANRK